MIRLLTCVFGPETHDDQKTLKTMRVMLTKSQHSTPPSLKELTEMRSRVIVTIMAMATTTSARRGTG
jgi:hypothetical protein